MKWNKLHKIKCLLGLVLCIGSISLTVIAAPTDLDPTFGNGGKVVSSPDGSQSIFGYAIALQPDGKIVMAGSRASSVPSPSEFVVARYNSDGSLDTTFGNNGWSSVTFDGNSGIAVSVDIQPDGKIVIGGTVGNFAPGVQMRDFGIVRFNPNGSLDASFDGDGKLTISFNDILGSVYLESLSVLKVANDGKIVAAGQALNSTVDDKFIVARINADGSLDSTFGTNGKFADQAGISNQDRISDLVILPDGKIVVVGTLLTVVGNYRTAIKYNTSGAREWTYQQGVNGVTSGEALNGIAALPDGKFIVVGKRSGKIAAIRLNANGTADATFSNTATMPSGEVYSVAIQPDGKIVANVLVNGSNSSFSLIRYNTDGSLDSGFGNSGIVNTSVTNGQDVGRKLLIQPDGKFLVGGYSQLSSPTRYYFTLVRYKGDAAFSNNPSFDYDGDGKSDVSVFRPSENVWYLNQSTNGFSAVRFGNSTDKIVPADYDGDGRTDIAVYRDGIWYWLNSSNGGFNAVQFGQAGDVPVPADYTGDGRAELAVYRGGFWYTLNLASNGFQGVQFGNSTDKPVPADFDADGRTDFAVYRDGVWYLLRSTAGFTAVQFGISSDQPTVGDYDGDGKADQAVYRSGVWYVLGSMQGFYGFQFGAPSDVPVVADYDGDGKTDVAVFRDGIWYMQRSQQGFGAVQFGATNDRPIPAAFVP